MPFNSVIDRTDAGALIPEEASREIFKGVAEGSAFMRQARRLQDISRKQFRIPVLSVLPTAYFVSPGASDDTGLKQTSEANWENVYITAEELAVIVPIPEAVLDDTDYDVWAELQPAIVEAFGKAVDLAAFYGTNRPTTWPAGIVSHASGASNNVSLATVTGGGGDVYDAILGSSGIFAKLEEDGFMATGAIGALSLRGTLRSLRGTDKLPVFNRTPGSKFQYELDGVPVDFPRNGGVVAGSSLLIAADWTQVVYAFRQDLTYKILDQAVIQDSAGNVIYNLAQQDMVAMRAVMRLGWQIPNPVNRVQETKASRSPFAVLTP